MAFFEKQDLGRVYVLKMELPDETVIHKVGMCKTSRSTDRMMEILRSWFNSYRYVPYTELKLDQETGHPEKLEKHIHNILSENRFIPEHKVSGGTEMFTGIDEIRLLHYIRNCENVRLPAEMSSEEYKIISKLVTH